MPSSDEKRLRENQLAKSSESSLQNTQRRERETESARERERKREKEEQRE